MKRGYTLTEVLIAVAIIAALAVVVIPIGGSMKRTSNRAACLSKLKNLGVAVEAYANDFGGNYPNLVMGRIGRESGEDEPVLESVLLEYVGNDEAAFQCPADSEHFEKTGSSYFWNHQLSGLPKTNVSLLGMDTELESIPLITDKEAFHGDDNGTNFLYADQSSGNKVKFETGSR